jgi:RNA polymerase sigma factor (sigma-70 family)
LSGGAGGGESGRPLLVALYTAHRQRLYAYLWGQTGHREDALDLLQEVFARAWTHIADLEALPPERRTYWLLACARRLCVDRHRRRAAARRAGDIMEAAAAAGPSVPAPQQAAEDAEAWRRVNGAIAALPRELREVLAMSVLGEMESAEVGAALGIAASTARYRLMRARDMLRAALGLARRDGRRG